LEQRVEARDIGLQRAAVPFDPRRHFDERLDLDAHRPTLGIAPASDQARTLEHLQVLGDRRLAHGERRRQFGDRGLAPGQTREEGAARPIGERGKRGVEAIGGPVLITSQFHKSVP
jgi:hypothetical protein